MLSVPGFAMARLRFGSVLKTQYAYDPNGNTTRFEGKTAQPVFAGWDAFGRMISFYDGVPESETSTSIERYLYEGGRLRVVRGEEHHQGEITVSIRDITGTVVAEYVVDPASGEAELAREYVYGAGHLLVEREAGQGDTQSLHSTSTMETGGAYSFTIPEAPADAIYDLRIETTGGFLNHVRGIQPDSSGEFTVDEAEFSLGDTNFLRTRRVSPTESSWSGALSLVIDDTVTSSSDNQVRAISIGRAGNDISIRWDLLEDNGKGFNVYARRTDGAATYLLTPMGLDASARSHALTSQALSSPCVEFFLSQLTPNPPPAPPTESSESDGAVFHAELEDPGQGCPGVGSPPTPEISPFVNHFHHRDHLGTLRLITTDSGGVLEALDFYPFGMEMAGPEIGLHSSRKYTGHERDERTGLDYMMARYKGVAEPGFLSPDPDGRASIVGISTWIAHWACARSA